MTPQQLKQYQSAAAALAGTIDVWARLKWSRPVAQWLYEDAVPWLAKWALELQERKGTGRALVADTLTEKLVRVYRLFLTLDAPRLQLGRNEWARLGGWVRGIDVERYLDEWRG